VVDHDDTRSGFADDSGPHFAEDAADELWSRVTSFLHEGVAHERNLAAADFAARVEEITATLRSDDSGPGER